jgi:hypothetical protein
MLAGKMVPRDEGLPGNRRFWPPHRITSMATILIVGVVSLAEVVGRIEPARED